MQAKPSLLRRRLSFYKSLLKPSVGAFPKLLLAFHLHMRIHYSTLLSEQTKVVENLGSSSPLKDLFYALKVNGILKCKVDRDVLKGIASRLRATVNDASTLIDTYYTIGSLVLIKDQAPDVDVLLADADGIFHSIKALSQSDGRWRYSSDNPESSTYAAGLALEALAGVVSLASSEIDQSRVKFSLEAAKSALSNASIGMYDTSADDGFFSFLST